LQSRAAKETAQTSKTNDSPGKGRPPHIILIWEANLIRLQRKLKSVVKREFFFRNTAARIRITTKRMMDYNTAQILRTEKNIHFFTIYTKADKPDKAVIRHLPGNALAEDITVALQDVDYDVISVKQMTTNRSILEGGVTHTSLPLFLVTLATNPKAPENFKLATLCNIALNIEAYRSRNGIIHCCLRSCDQQNRQQPSQQSSGNNKHQDTNQISRQSVQAKNVNISATKDVFLAFTVVKQARKRKGCCHN
jgi:hypothetical protein